MKILLANPPWDIGSCRAGSRWAHRNEGKESGLLDRVIHYLDRPRKPQKKRSYRVFPLFMAQAAAILEESGFAVKVIDSIATDQTREDFIKESVAYRPDICIFETATASFNNDKNLMKEIKEKIGCVSVMCGQHASALPNDVLKHEFIDFVAIGEYELVLDNLAKTISEGKSVKNVLGIGYKDNGKTRINPRQPLIEDLDAIPLPAYHLMPMERYWTPYSGTDTSMEIMSTRGCPFKCTYCIFPQIFYNSHRVRFRKPERVVDEIELLLTKYGKEGIYFNDDTFTLRKSHVMGICNEIKRRGLEFPWGCFGRVDTVDREMLEAMRNSGCIIIKYGVESGCQKILDNVQKGYKLNDIRRAFKMTKDVGIKMHATLMIGLPGETPETVRKTLRFVKEINPDTTVWALLTPYPGTRIYAEAEEKGWIETRDWNKYDGGNHAVMRTEAMSSKEIEMMWEYARNEWALFRKSRKSQIRNFFSAKYKESGIVGIPTGMIAKVLQIAKEMRLSKINRIK